MGSLIAGIGSFFGLEDELIIISSKVSTKIYGQNVEKASKNAITKAVLGKAADLNSSHSYFDHYWYQINSTRASLTTFYLFGLNRFPESIPNSEISGITIDESAVSSAIGSEKGSVYVLKEVSSRYPTDLEHFQELLQAPPYLYRPAIDTLTYTDSTTGISYDDWAIRNTTFKSMDSTFDITLTRQASVAEFWLTGDPTVVEGRPAQYTLHSTRKVPAGSSINVTLVYGGPADVSDYTQVGSVDMLEGQDSVNFTVNTLENAIVDGSRAFTVSIDVIDNTGNIFQSVASIVPNIVTTLIYDNDTPTLYVQNKKGTEALGSVVVGVELLQTSVPFTVDFTTIAGTATAGADYVTTSGTLAFEGVAGEMQGITVPIISDLVDDAGETFSIALSNSSEPSVDINSQGIVTITDSSVEIPDAATSTTTEILNLPDYIRKQSLIIKYFNNSADPLGVDWRLWIYDLSLGIYAGMVPAVGITTGLELFPLGVVRREAISLKTYGSAAEILSMDLMLKRLNLSLDDVIDNVESSSNIDLIREAYVNISVSPLDGGQEVAKLLWHLLYPIVVETPVSSNQGQFKVTVTKGKIENVVSWTSQQFIPSLTGVVATIGEFRHFVSGTSLFIDHQTSANLYDRLQITGIEGNYKVEFEGEYHLATNNLESEDLTFPVSWFSLNQLSAKEQMNVYDKIVRLDFYAVEEVEVAWYKTESFMKLFQVVLIVITIVSAGITAPATAGAATATTAGATSSLLVVAKQIAINYAISAIVSAIAKATGNPFLAVAVGIFEGIAFAGGMDSFKGFSGMPDAKTLLSMSTDFVEHFSGAYRTVLNQDAEELNQDIEEFEQESKKRLDAIAEANYDPEVDEHFLAFLRSADSGIVAAISGLYEYDVLYDYDRLVGRYNENLLKIGVV